MSVPGFFRPRTTPAIVTSTLARAVPDDYESLEPGDRVLLIVEDDMTFAITMLEMARASGFKGVVATRGEFDSIDVILRQYALRGRIRLRFVEPRNGGHFAAEDLLAAVRDGADLLVVSQVVFNTGQVLPELLAVVAAARAGGARVLLDVYHSLGVFPIDVAALDGSSRRTVLHGGVPIQVLPSGFLIFRRSSDLFRWLVRNNRRPR